MDAHNHHAHYFQDISQRLCNIDTEYFATLAQKSRISFIFQVEIVYDLNLTKLTALDLSAFPELRKVLPHELSSYQRQDFSKTKRNINTMPAKLVSDCRKTIITEHVDNLLFLLVWFSGRIVRVRSCVQFTTYPFLRAYCNDMAQKRANSVSKVQKDYCKLLTNSLAGEDYPFPSSPHPGDPFLFLYFTPSLFSLLQDGYTCAQIHSYRSRLLHQPESLIKKSKAQTSMTPCPWAKHLL